MMSFKAELRSNMQGVCSRVRSIAARFRKSAEDVRNYDRQAVAVMERVLGGTSNCIDIGASAGAILKHMVRLAPGGTHFAFEPLPDFHKSLVRKFPSVTVYNLALSDTAASTPFQYVVTNPAYSGLRRRRYERPDEQVKEIVVRTARLDELIPEDLPVHFIKIDVEGAESQVLMGGLETIRRTRPFIVFEFGMGAADYYGTQPEDLYRLLSGCGLQVSLIHDWLLNGTPLREREFAEEFREYRNYCFLAHR
jgi:FkbM family methyltransferase